MAMPLTDLPQIASEEESRLWRDGAALSSFFPLRMPDGSVYGNLSCYCSACNSQLAQEQLRGQITGPVFGVYTVSGVGLCRHCGAFSVIHLRLRSGGGADGIVPGKHGNRWAEIDMTSPATRWVDLRSWIRVIWNIITFQW